MKKFKIKCCSGKGKSMQVIVTISCVDSYTFDFFLIGDITLLKFDGTRKPFKKCWCSLLTNVLQYVSNHYLGYDFEMLLWLEIFLQPRLELIENYQFLGSMFSSKIIQGVVEWGLHVTHTHTHTHTYIYI